MLIGSHASSECSLDGGVCTQECMRGNVKENFEHIKGYRAYCYGKNILIKFKGGDLVPQQGATASFWTKKKLSQGGGIDMSTNITTLEPVEVVHS